MSPVANASYSTLFFFSIALVLALTRSTDAGAAAFCYLGSIQLLNALAPRFPTPLARLIHWTHAMTFEGFALLGVAALRLIPVKLKVSGQGRPILLVHGYVNHGSVWTLHKKHLETLGLGPIYTINLGYPFRSIRTYAENVKVKAEEIAKETDRADLILIGHSMGGLVSTWYATHLAPPNTVTDVITIGSPLSGTLMAKIGLGPNAREMEPNSPFLSELQQAIGENKKIHFYHIATKSDQVVIPGQSAVLSQNSHFILEDVGHASLLYSKRVSGQIAEWLS